MQFDHDEIMRRAAAISPTLSAHARECDVARKLTAESMAARRQSRHVPDSAAAPRRRLRTESADARRRCYIALRGVPLERLGADGYGCASLVHGFVSRGGAGRSLWRWPRRPGRGNVVVAGNCKSGRGRLPRRRAMAILQRRRSCSLGNPGMRRPSTHRPSVHVVVPRGDLEVDDTWHVMGLQGTGSKDVLAHNVFVPSHRAIDTRILFRGASPHAANHATNLYRLSAEAMLSVSVATAVLGSAKFALRQFIERTKERRVILTGARKAEHGPTQVRLAEAAAEIRSADLLIHDILGEFDRLMATGETFDNDHRVRAKWQAAYSAELCRRAVARMFSGSGAHAVYTPSALQAAFRNVNVGAQHASIDFDNSAELYARAASRLELVMLSGRSGARGN